MDEQLAAIYGTGQMDEEDLEKNASAELLVKLAEEEGVDLDDFSDEEIAGMIDELQGQETVTDESQEKVAEADYLGRVMAHSMVQELGEIEKEAKFTKAPIYTRAGKAVKRAIMGSPERYRKAGRGISRAVTGKGSGAVKKLKAGTRVREALKAGKRVAPEAAGLAALTGGAVYAGTRGKKKKASAIDKLAEDRAFEILAESGWVDDEGNVFVPEGHEQEKIASELDVAVETQALQMLEEAGYPVQWNE